jgi:hypothetical protein
MNGIIKIVEREKLKLVGSGNDAAVQNKIEEIDATFRIMVLMLIDQIINKTGPTKYQKISDILNLLVEYCQIDKKKYIIFGSEITSIDIYMDYLEWEKLLTYLLSLKLGTVQTNNNKQMRYILDLTSTYQKIDPQTTEFAIKIIASNSGYPTDEFSIANLIQINCVNKDKHGQMSLNNKTLLKWKKLLNYPECAADIANLEKVGNHEYRKPKRKSKAKKNK